MSTRADQATSRAELKADEIADCEYLSPEARKAARALSRLIAAESGRYADTLSLHRRELAEEYPATLDGQPAKVSGWLSSPSAAVISVSARDYVLRDWAEVEHVLVNRGGRFSR